MSINARQVNILRPNTSGTWTTLDQFMNRKRVLQIPFVEVQEVAVAAAQFVLVNSTTHLPGGKLTVLKASPPTTLTTNAGICAAELVGAIGTAATTNHTDNYGNILNMVIIRDTATHDEITVNVGGTERTVFGLVQCANGVAEGANVGVAASENTQLSFVYIAADGTITLTTITATIEFQVNKVYIESQQADVMLVGGRAEEIVTEPKAILPLARKFVVTAAFASGEVLTLSTGAGSGTGTSTASGDTVVLDASAALFNANHLNRVRLNGIQLIRGAGLETEWESTLAISVNIIMDINDVLEVEIAAL